MFDPKILLISNLILARSSLFLYTLLANSINFASNSRFFSANLFLLSISQSLRLIDFKLLISESMLDESGINCLNISLRDKSSFSISFSLFLSLILIFFISAPSAFTETTGKKHWHSLLQARAIENFSYIFAPAQCGKHWNKRRTYGHSLIISPDGKILKELKKGAGVITANIDPKLSVDLRKKIPSLKN